MDSQRNERPRPQVMRGADIGRAQAIRGRMEAHRKDLPEPTRVRLATNLGRLLSDAKAQRIGMDRIVKQAVPLIPHLDEKPGNALSDYRIAPGSKRTRKRKLYAKADRYLALALSAARAMGIEEHDAVLALADGTALFDTSIRDDSKLGAADRIYALLEARLMEIAIKYDLAGYLQQVMDLRAVPVYDSNGFSGWGVDHYGFEVHETDAWPSILLCAVVRDAVKATIQKGNDVFQGEAVYAEKLYLTLGWDYGLRKVRPLFEVTAAAAARPAGPDGWLRFDGPWITWGHPPTTGMFWPSNDVVVRIAADQRLQNGVQTERDWDFVNQDPYSCSRLVKLNIAVLNEFLVNLKEFQLEPLSLPRGVIGIDLLSPPFSLLAKVEAVLLGRHKDEAAVEEFGESPDFLAKFDAKAELLTRTFREWWANGKEKARSDHQEAITEAHARLATVQKQKASILEAPAEK